MMVQFASGYAWDASLYALVVCDGLVLIGQGISTGILMVCTTTPSVATMGLVILMVILLCLALLLLPWLLVYTFLAAFIPIMLDGPGGLYLALMSYSSIFMAMILAISHPTHSMTPGKPKRATPVFSKVPVGTAGLTVSDDFLAGLWWSDGGLGDSKWSISFCEADYVLSRVVWFTLASVHNIQGGSIYHGRGAIELSYGSKESKEALFKLLLNYPLIFTQKGNRLMTLMSRLGITAPSFPALDSILTKPGFMAGLLAGDGSFCFGIPDPSTLSWTLKPMAFVTQSLNRNAVESDITNLLSLLPFSTRKTCGTGLTVWGVLWTSLVALSWLRGFLGNEMPNCLRLEQMTIVYAAMDLWGGRGFVHRLTPELCIAIALLVLDLPVTVTRSPLVIDYYRAMHAQMPMAEWQRIREVKYPASRLKPKSKS